MSNVAHLLRSTVPVDTVATSLPGNSTSGSLTQEIASPTETPPVASKDGSEATTSSSGPSMAVVIALSVALGIVALAAAVIAFFAWRRHDRGRYHRRAPDLVTFDLDGDKSGASEKAESPVGPIPVPVGGILSFNTASPSRRVSDIPARKRPPPTPDASSTLAEDGSVTESTSRDPQISPVRGGAGLPVRPGPKPTPPPSGARETPSTQRRSEAIEVTQPEGGTDRRERVLVLPWSLGERLLGLTGSPRPRGGDGASEEGRDGDSEPPPAYEPRSRQRRAVKSGARSTRSSAGFRSMEDPA
ncbi:hypothetical protein OH77DRAFT_1223157 [Trametes cingulata]|nr:hypothetical protein OH77DRAFT_1223157 [Trametes cingulata]